MRPDPAARAAGARPLRAALTPTPRAALLSAVLLAAAGAAWIDAAAAPGAQEQVERGLLCHCGCSGLTVHTCTCGTAATIREEITSRLAAGETADQVIAAYVARHGEKVRPAPTKEGFNLLAWITPFAALLVAGVAVVLLVRRWGARGALPAPDAPHGTGPAAGVPAAPGQDPPSARDRQTLARIERELRERR